MLEVGKKEARACRLSIFTGDGVAMAASLFLFCWYHLSIIPKPLMTQTLYLTQTVSTMSPEVTLPVHTFIMLPVHTFLMLPDQIFIFNDFSHPDFTY